MSRQQSHVQRERLLHARPGQRRSESWCLGILFLFCFAVLLQTRLLAQDDDLASPPLHERDPFDRITLDPENESARVEIYPIDDIDRSKPVAESGQRSFVIRRIQDPPDQLHSVSASHIVKFELFHEMLLVEAKRLIEAKKVDEAFPYLARLANDYPSTAGLDQTLEEFHLADARNLFVSRRFDEALLALDQVYERNPNRPGLDRILQRVLDEIVRSEFKAGNFESVRRKLNYARDRYGATTKTAIDSWQQRLEAEATKQLVLASQAFDDGDPTEALASCRRAMQIWPELEGLNKLHRAVLAKYPRIRVGVGQAYRPRDANLLPRPLMLNWALRRTEPLLRRNLVEFVEFTADGGRYGSPIASVTTSSDRRQITLSLRSGDGAYDLCRSLLRIADKTDPAYSPRWAEFLQSIFVPTSNTLEINLTRSMLQPIALLPRSFPASDIEFVGNFTLQDGGQGDIQNFMTRDPASSVPNGVREVAEHFFENPSSLADALISGEIDVIDRVYPLDLSKLKSQPNISVVPYRIPTIHALVFNDREPLLRSSTFRRGLLYAIDRAQFVRTEIIGEGSPSIAEVLSAPLPIGLSADDPLGYAYSRNITPRDHDPSLALVLLRLAQAQRTLLENRLKPRPESRQPNDGSRPGAGGEDEADVQLRPEMLPPLVIAYPTGPIARSACTAIAFDLRRIGLDVTIRQLDAGATRPADSDWDMLYIEATIEEPFVDFPELVLGHSLLGRHGGFVRQATRSLQQAADLEEARNHFARIHKICFDHTPILPLWQIIEHLAFRENIHGIGDAPVTLYQNISNWRFTP